MKIFDLNRLEQDSSIEVDLVVIGSGPAGLSIANEFAGTSTRVLVLEGGGLADEADSQSLYEIESTGAPRVIPQDNIRRRILGGSSHVWTGRCAPFDSFDYEARPWIPYSGWPLSGAEMEPYFERAAFNLGIAPNRYDEGLWQAFRVNRPTAPISEGSLRPMFWQFSTSWSGAGSAHFGRDLVHAEAPNVEILLHANVTHINLSGDGNRFESVDVRSLYGKRACVRAKVAVLCCGGIENARLMLASNRVYPQGVGNRNDLVGRFLMDHTHGSMGHFEQSEADAVRSRFGHYWLDDARGRHVYLHGLGLNLAEQEREQLLNCHAYIEESAPEENDPWSALKRLAGSVRSRRIPRADALLVATHLGTIAKGMLRRRFAHRPQLAKVAKIELHCMLEQMPDPESRVTLSDTKKDALGMPTLVIHWRVSDAERKTASRMIQLVSDEFARLGLPRPKGIPELREQSDWIARSVEKAHPTGTTRMCNDPAQGVVDANSEVHGIRGLFVSGSSIFPTAGAANPTLMIVATALRLADHLKRNVLNEAGASSTAPATLRDRYADRARSAPSPTAIKVGFIGSGHRISEVYLPILRQMSEEFAAVGFTTHSAAGARRLESASGLPSYPSAVDLIKQARPDFVVLAVPDRENEAAIAALLDLRIPILAETPLAWSASSVRRIIDRATAAGVVVGVAEQFPFLPLDHFRKQLVATGVPGDIYAVVNDFQSYSYHGIAQLRSYLKGAPAVCRCTEFGVRPLPGNGFSSQWQSGSVEFDDGSLLLHQFETPARSFGRSTRIYGSNGLIDETTTHISNPTSGRSESFAIERLENAAGHLASLSAGLGKYGVVTWENPFAAYRLSDEQIAVATLLRGMSRAVREGVPPLYTPGDFLCDIEIVQAFRYSAARNGAAIRLPVNERREKALQMVSPRAWKRRFS